MIVLFLLCLSKFTAALYVCGNYCGPSWCAQLVMDETSCVQQNYWGSADDGSCIDQCCKAHDYCCGAGDRSQCNDMIANCAYYCSGPCADAVWGVMRTLDTFCCGGPCDQDKLDFIEAKFGKRPVETKEGVDWRFEKQ